MVGRALSLLFTWAEGRAVSGGWPREATVVFCPALGGVCAGGMHSTPLLLFKSGIWVFLVSSYLLSRICPN